MEKGLQTRGPFFIDQNSELCEIRDFGKKFIRITGVINFAAIMINTI